MEEEDIDPVDPEKMRPNIAPVANQPVEIKVQLGNNPFGGKDTKAKQDVVNHKEVLVQNVDESGDIQQSINVEPK